MASEYLCCGFDPCSVSNQGLGLLVGHTTDVLVCTCVPVHRQWNSSFDEKQGWD